MSIFWLQLIQLWLLTVLLVSPSSSSRDAPPIAKPGCVEECGDVRIPYPFGIGANCSHDKFYEIICNNSTGTHKPFLQRFNLEVMDINWDGKYTPRDPQYHVRGSRHQSVTVWSSLVNMCTTSSEEETSIDFHGSPYRFSTWYNVFVAVGCGSSAVFKNRSGEILTGCTSLCANDSAAHIDSTATSGCYGAGCCQASFLSSPTSEYQLDETEGVDFYKSVVVVDHEAALNSSACNMAGGLIQSSSVNKFAGKLLLSNLTTTTFPTVLQWSGPYIDTPREFDNVSCDEQYGFRQCVCQSLLYEGKPYEGNPYLPNGCQVVRECRKCRHRCSIKFRPIPHYHCLKNPWFKWRSILGYSIGMGSVLMLLSCYWLYQVVKRKKEVKRKANYFKRNGGLLLQQQMSSSEGVMEKTKIFSIMELEKATDNFNENRILGQGGQGTVYKGMLTDGKIVAIKKSKKIDESQLEQFINEVVILGQINHRNVVKLLGCCLETEVPLLVYEFVPNGTLYQHIQHPSEDFHVTWKMRLQIASESAGAVAYLHSSSSTPIYHRDIKSSNILLDDKYRAKVSDFGTSRAITIEQTHVTTCVIGTYGYLDPEYFQSHQFTEKSDVYSFGVVLVELITGKKPICSTDNGGWISLASEFLIHMENSRLFDILDTRISEEGKEEDFIAVAELARQCLNMNGKQRPAMKEIAKLLDDIRCPRVPNWKQPNSAESECVIMETSDINSGPFSRSSFFSDCDPGTSCSVEAQPLMANTLRLNGSHESFRVLDG